MKKLLLFLLFSLLFIGCVKDVERYIPDQHSEYVYKMFGTTFDTDWNMTYSSDITVYSQGMEKIQILGYNKTDELCFTTVLNEVEGNSKVTLNYDAPNDVKSLYVAGIGKDGNYYIKPFTFEDTSVTLDTPINKTRAALTRATGVPTIGGSIISYETQRGYPGFENEVLYYQDNPEIDVANNYSENDQLAIRAMIFEYLPNGKGYNNLPQILANGYYNNDCYAVTTGSSPILISPIYKNDGGYHEVETAELYYYYFKGDKTVDEIKALPKYKVLDVSQYLLDDDELKKHHTWTLAYFGDDATPTGSYDFPKGYKIGFMLRMNFKDDVKKGELYFDGRLNNDINRHGHFASSKLGNNGPRMCWLSINEMMFMGCEAGTDRDFNDIVFEIEGVEPIDIPIPPVYNTYIYCFEDKNLGDYDLNDVVIKGQRIDATHVEWSVLATGANDELYIKGIEGNTINKNKEIHSYFGIEQDQFANVGSRNEYPIVTEQVLVSSTFSFKHNAPYIENRTEGYDVHIATSGQDPHAIMIPNDFFWPKEKIRVSLAYPLFNSWGQGNIGNEWINTYVEDNVVK